MKLTKHELAVISTNTRLLAMEMVHRAKSGHIGGSLSSIEILTVLYHNIMNVDPERPGHHDRDRFVLSKGHCSPALYSALCLRGYFPQENLNLFRSIKGHMSGHAEMRYVPGVDMSTGSLGQGISAAVGMALAGKLDSKDYRVHVLLGDGELDEGQVWEAAMSAAKYQLDNLCAIVDVNGLQIDGRTSDVMPTEPLDKKFESFGWYVLHVNGHDTDELTDAFEKAAGKRGVPTVILAKTVKGKGVSFMENNHGWHGKAPNDDQYAAARAELEAALANLVNSRS